MRLVEFVGIAAVPVTLLTAPAALLVGVALATRKNREETLRALQARSLGADRLASFAGLWSLYFHRLFGERILARRQLLTIPLYTLAVSAIFFLTWFVYLYLFRNPSHSFDARLPLNVRQAVHDFYQEGIIATMAIDFAAIQMTKIAIRVGRKAGFLSLRFLLAFLGTLALAYFLFSLAVYYFRVADMVRLYLELAPGDPLPVIPYAPLGDMASSLRLFYPQTLIHVTSRGWFSTYFMPEPLIFYCAVAAQASLVAVTLAYQAAWGLERLKNLCVGILRRVGTPEANAASVVVFVLLVLVSVPLMVLGVVAALAGG